MGGYDVYCAICGGPLGNLITDDHPELWEEDTIYDRDIVTPSMGEWLDRVRIMGENSASGSMNKVFISGRATCEDAGFFSLDSGDDPNFPPHMDSLQAYNDNEDGLAFPFHDDCYDLLCAKIGLKAFRKDILYHTFTSYTDGPFAKVLSLDWGPLAERQQQYFEIRKGDEEYVLCPGSIPRLTEYYASLPQLELHQQSRPRISKRQTSKDAFAGLPVELLHILLDHLSLRDMLALRQASAAAYELELTNAFWKQRIERDMPWLYDMPLTSVAYEQVDWLAVYKYMYAATQRGNTSCILPLVNRRRIWTTMDQIMDTYFTEWHRVQSRTSPILTDAQAGNMALLVLPEPSDTKRSHLELLHDFSEIYHAQPRITVYRGDAEDVAGLSVEDGNSTDIIGDSRGLAHSDSFIMPIDDWLKEVTLISTTEYAPGLAQGRSRPAEKRRLVGVAFSFAHQEPLQFGQQVGDKRILQPSPGHVIIGFMGDASQTGQISRLAVLEQPREQFPADCSRITYATGLTRDTSMERSLWHDSVPDCAMVMSDYQKGYWSYDVKVDTLAMEQLVFAGTGTERANITRISGDMHMGGFRIEYSNREPRTIGPRLKMMRSMSVDGAGGERIVCVTSFVEHIVRGLRFLTNRGRVLAIGLNGNNPKRYSSAQLDSRELTGLYCSWSGRCLPSSQLQTFGVLSKDHGALDSTAPSIQEPVDNRGSVWQPLSAPQNLSETGRIWGEYTFQLRPNLGPEGAPGQGSIVSYLDCTRPVAEVEIFTCHPLSPYLRPRLDVVGLAFRYADGECERAEVGYTEILPDPKYDDQVREAFPDWCQCTRGRGPGVDHDDHGPHFRSARWSPAAGRIRGLKFWLDDRGALIGMRFLAEDDSPVFGSTGDEGSSGQIRFGKDEAEGKDIVGVKLFMNGNGRAVTYDDVVVVAVQALAREG